MKTTEQLLKCKICGAKRKNLSAHVRNSNNHPSWRKYEEMFHGARAMVYDKKFVESGKETRYEKNDSRLTGKNNPNAGGISEEHRHNVIKALSRPEVKRTLSKQKLGDKNPAKDPEVRKKISESLKGRFTGSDHPNYGATPTNPKSVYIPELGHGVRSSWEREICSMLKDSKIDYSYEPKRFNLGEGNFWPDIEITPNKLYVEVRGFNSSEDVEKLLKFQEKYPNITLIGILGSGEKTGFDVCISWEEHDKLPQIIKEMIDL